MKKDKRYKDYRKEKATFYPVIYTKSTIASEKNHCSPYSHWIKLPQGVINDLGIKLNCGKTSFWRVTIEREDKDKTKCVHFEDGHCILYEGRNVNCSTSCEGYTTEDELDD